MKTVITYGSFDLFHVGHVRVLERARSLGDRLIVGCSTDEFNSSKGKKALFTYNERAEILKACRYVDAVFPEENWEQKQDDIRKYEASIFTIGDDWVGKFDFLSDLVDVVYMPRTSGISTTEIKQVVKSINDEKLFELKNAIDHVHSLASKIK